MIHDGGISEEKSKKQALECVIQKTSDSIYIIVIEVIIPTILYHPGQLSGSCEPRANQENLSRYHSHNDY